MLSAPVPSLPAMGSLQEAASASAFRRIQGSGHLLGVRSLEETVAFLKDHPARIQPLA